MGNMQHDNKTEIKIKIQNKTFCFTFIVAGSIGGPTG